MEVKPIVQEFVLGQTIIRMLVAGGLNNLLWKKIVETHLPSKGKISHLIGNPPYPMTDDWDQDDVSHCNQR